MLILDSSALLAIIFGAPAGADCIELIATYDELAISAAVLTEALVVAGDRQRRRELERLIEALGPEVVPVKEADAKIVADAYSTWGIGRRPGGLDYGDCFSYALAKQRGAPLLFIGDKFLKTDVQAAISEKS
jgi:ribonuclease VapC